MITELGCAVGYHPERGWAGAMSQEAYALELLRAAQIYWLHNVPVCIYSYGSWHNFGIEYAGVLLQRLCEYGARLPVENPTNSATTAKVNLRSATLVGMGNVVRILESGTPLVIKPQPILGGEYFVSNGVYRKDWYEVVSPSKGYVAAAFVRSL